MPEDGYVPDATTAKAVAEAIWVPFYGRDLVSAEKPQAVSNNDEEPGSHPRIIAPNLRSQC